MMMRRIVLATSLGAFALFGSVPPHEQGLEAAARMQEHDHNHGATVTTPEKATLSQDMMATVKANDARLDALVKTMNDAKGTAKVDAIAAVVNALVEERRTMRTGMGEGPMMNMMGNPGKMGGMGQMGGSMVPSSGNEENEKGATKK